jgi:pyridoxal phosphate enzyme (YggS family)
MSSAVAQQLRAVRERIERACRRSGRDPGDVTLVAVSKRKPADLIRRAYDAGQRDFGENYAQDLLAKAEALADLDGIRWHFIGPLQRNKVKLVIGRAALLHSIDSTSQIEALQRRVARDLPDLRQELLIQLNLSAEATKAGIDHQQFLSLLRACEAAQNLRCVGLMTMPPAVDDPTANAPYFAALARLRDELAPRYPLPHLSMGMTQDFEVAIAHGATILRVGTAIFGERQ